MLSLALLILLVALSAMIRSPEGSEKTGME